MRSAQGDAQPGAFEVGVGFGTRAGTGGLFLLGGQAVKMVIQIGSIACLARLLAPGDFGLVAMLTAATAMLHLFKDGGLAIATMQEREISHDQISTLFWANVALSLCMTILLALLSPVLAWFFSAPALEPLGITYSLSFLFGGLSVQHQALLARNMRYRTLSLIDIAALAAGAVAGVVMAMLGTGYWALLAMLLVQNALQSLLCWTASEWRPGRPALSPDSWPLLRLGWQLTSANVATYLARNVDNLLIGWYWGAAALGFYNQAYRLLLVPVRQINDPLTRVVIPSLSAVQADHQRYARFYVLLFKGILYVTMPFVGVLVVFSNSIVAVLLGAQWSATVPIFRALSIAAILQPAINALGWLYLSTGRGAQFLRIGLINAGLIILCFCALLRFGPTAMAWGFSTMLVILLLPLISIGCRGTPVVPIQLLRAMFPPAILSLILCVVATLVRGLAAPNAGLTLWVDASALAAGLACATATALAWPQTRGDANVLMRLARNLFRPARQQRQSPTANEIVDESARESHDRSQPD